ncbi:NAD(P)/FAD-dependent oxidoreductase [Candidatus Giovannonibacteria bacterium]|nr:NAD(P)/FAD-dependent oxidoreductase [Candidatus Giovannonibacteria bacterium]
MERFDYLVVGGGIAGTTAAETIREKNFHASIAILEAEPHTLYSKLSFPKYLNNQISRKQLFLREVSDYERKRIDFFPRTYANKIDPERHEVFCEDGRIFSYKKLLIASGSRPDDPPEYLRTEAGVPGEGSRVLRLHSLDDADSIKETFSAPPPRSIIVAGETFAALELFEIFYEHDFEVHAVAKGNFFGERMLGSKGGEILERHLQRKRIVIHKNAEIAYAKGTEFRLSNGDKFSADFAGIATGVQRNVEAFRNLKNGKGIWTDEFFMTSVPDIYAAGDAAEFFDVISGRRRLMSDWTMAFLSGRTAALNMLDERVPFKSVTSYNIVIFGVSITSMGDTEDWEDTLEYPEENGVPSFLRLFLKEGRLKGAIFINRFADASKISSFIEHGSSQEEVKKAF